MTTAFPSPSAKPATCAVLLGASNLSLAWPRIMELLQRQQTGPLHILTAHGMGRSYFLERTGFAFQQLPGILNCGIWDNLPTGSEHRCLTFITDVGNDIVYGQPVQQIADAVQECIRRLRAWSPDGQIALARPPMDSVAQLGWLRFRIFRAVLFPRSTLSLDQIKVRTAELDHYLQDIAAAHHLPIMSPAAHWYGLDPIHVRRRHQREAFHQLMRLWDLPETPSGRLQQQDGDTDILTSRPTAALRWTFNRDRETDQPSVGNARITVSAY